MTSKDLNTTVAVGVITYAVIAALSGLGVVVPAWVGSVPTLVTFVALAALRIVVAVKGEDNTQIDEALERAEDAIERIAAVAKARKP